MDVKPYRNTSFVTLSKNKTKINEYSHKEQKNVENHSLIKYCYSTSTKLESKLMISEHDKFILDMINYNYNLHVTS